MRNTKTTTQCCDYYYNLQGQDWSGDAHGKEQSPIDILPLEALNSNPKMKMEFILNDHTIPDLKVNDSGNALLVNGPFSKLKATDINGDFYEFEAVQFHFHAPAEHTINGGQYELELHIVHRMTAESAARAKTHRTLAVVGIFFQLDSDPKAEPNAFIDALSLEDVEKSFDLNMNMLLGGHLRNMMTFYAYKGSLTTPPCSETVNWYLFETPLKITRNQLNRFDMRWKCNPEFAGGHGNNRAIQAVNGRAVMKSTNCCVLSSSEEEAASRIFLENKPVSTTDLSMRRNMMVEKLIFHKSGLNDEREFADSPMKKSGSASHRLHRDKRFEDLEKKNSQTPTLRESSFKKAGLSRAGTFQVNKESRFSQFAAELKSL